MNRVKAVEREYGATRYATDHLLGVVRQDPTALKDALEVRDVRLASEQLEGTYIIRLFAEFETSLRVFWGETRNKRAPSRTRDLLESTGAKRMIPDDQIQNAHRVRDYRNVLVHQREGDVEQISIGQARSHLCHFLSFLPPVL